MTSMYASLTAIGRQLHREYLPILAEPLSSELEGLLARVVALEMGKRRSIGLPVEALRLDSVKADQPVDRRRT